jgi:hypothetical protein
MLGNKWMINLDDQFDVDQIKSLDKELCIGIAKSNHHLPTPGVKPLYIDSPTIIEKEYINSGEISDLTQYERRMFLRLYEKQPFNVRSVYVKQQTHYNLKHLDSESDWTENAKHFPELIKFINTLPFEQYGRIEIFVADANNRVPIHIDAMSDSDITSDPGDFLWISTRGNDKKFHVIGDDGKKHYASYISWFNERDPHGSDPVPFAAYSIRIDGIFLPGVRDKWLTL